MLISLLPVPVFAAPASNSEKEPIPKDAIMLSTPEDVLALAENCRVNTWSVGKTVVLKNNIDMEGVAFEGIPTFGGNFRGEGYTISGIDMQQEGSVVGFFRYLQKTAVVSQLNIAGIVMPEGSKSRVGGFVGSNAGTIKQCQFNGTVSGYEKIGGIAGVNEVSGIIEDSSVNGMVYGSHFVGGLVGENQGVVRDSINYGEINTKSVQNSVSIEDISLDSLLNTENASTTTDIGGIVGISSGVIRACKNYGSIGYQSMGYNIGGIVGTQNGYVASCINYADVQGRKEVGGIVGHMEPNIVIDFDKDTLQTLSDQLVDLEESLNALEGSIKDASTEVDNQMDSMENSLSSVEDSIDELSNATEDFSESMEKLMDAVEIYVDAAGALVDEMEKLEESDEMTAIQNKIDELEEALDALSDSETYNEIRANLEEAREVLNELEVLIEDADEKYSPGIEEKREALKVASENLDKVMDESTLSEDYDKVTAATNNLGSALDNLSSDGKQMKESLEDVTDSVSNRLDEVTEQIDRISATVQDVEEGIDLTLEDVSDEDTHEDTVGKVYKCTNYGAISGDLNIGGIAGVMAEENDLDESADTELSGKESLNITGKVRVVIRDCENYGTISAGKQYVGGVVGYMLIGAVIDSNNMGSLDSIHADYVGGIAGNSNAVIRGCNVKCILAGDAYVGGIAGLGNEVRDCYAVVDIKAYAEKAGAILGSANELPEGQKDDSVSGNRFYSTSAQIGGIDGIVYTGATDKTTLKDFLDSSDIPANMKKVEVRFIAEGQEDVVYVLKVGDTLSQEKIPALTVEADSEYEWEVIQAVTSEVLGMGEVAHVEYLSEETLKEILFDQTYQVSFDLKDTVISGAQRNDKGLSIILAEGTFAKNTTVEMIDALADGEVTTINGIEVVENWQIIISNSGVGKLHYLVSGDLEKDSIVLYVQDASGNWIEREYVVEGSYIVFDFTDGETGFALQQIEGGSGIYIVIVAAVMLVITIVIGCLVRKRMKKLK